MWWNMIYLQGMTLAQGSVDTVDITDEGDNSRNKQLGENKRNIWCSEILNHSLDEKNS